ncbi:MAG: bifunctional glutamate N-acetyltransferase/amino-acid acetyltransferase ArgJ [Gammaproteobacteria bacterium]|nr:bifunctional glutamate N-acetyltransferase/amino-acid acetyltransferase ArgJ [Gammaproteobacteria bacterium]
MSGVTVPVGFSAGGIAVGIKGNGDRDLAIVMAESAVPAAAVFTKSRTAAPPVVLARRRIADGRLRAVLLNSGCANAATGTAGMEAALATTRAAAEALDCSPEDVMPCSTGPIGSHLPVERVRDGIGRLFTTSGSSNRHADFAAEAIMTTDTVSKQTVRHGGGYVIGGMAKGAGMLRPDMATMLAVLTTDAEVDAATLGTVLREAVDVSFNSVNIDGCTSTNDTVVVLASGASGRRPSREAFADVLTSACKDLALKIAQDAEGASKVVTIRISGAVADADARSAGMTIADSALVRASFYGGDPNWGRIVAALGVSDAAFDPEHVEVRFGEYLVASAGMGVPFDEESLVRALVVGDFTVSVRIGDGPGKAEVLTTDLTPEYVQLNGERS